MTHEAKLAAPPTKIHYKGIDLELYDSKPMLLRSKTWYTYGVEGESGLWEHCPATGETIKTQD